MEENRKYELVKDDFILHEGRKLYRIRALRTISKIVSKGALGGYVGGYHNLSQEGDCWIYNDAKVYDNARIEDDATVGDAEVYGNARIKGTAFIYVNSQVYGNAVVKGDARIKYSRIYGNAVVKTLKVLNNVTICDNTEINEKDE